MPTWEMEVCVHFYCPRMCKTPVVSKNSNPFEIVNFLKILRFSIEGWYKQKPANYVRTSEVPDWTHHMESLWRERPQMSRPCGAALVYISSQRLSDSCRAVLLWPPEGPSGHLR